MKIFINNKNKKIPKELIDACNNEILAKIFFNRGITRYYGNVCAGFSFKKT